MKTTDFFRKLKKDEIFYTTIDGAYDRFAAFFFLVLALDFHYKAKFFVFLFVVKFVNIFIKNRYRIPRLGYAGYDDRSKPLNRENLLYLFFAIVLLIGVSIFESAIEIENHPLFQTVRLLFGHNQLAIVTLLFFSLVILAMKTSLGSFYIYFSLLIIFAGIQVILYPSFIIVPYALILLCLFALTISIYKLNRFLKQYPIINQETE